MLDPTTLSSLKVTELKAELKKRGLPVGGLKQALVERLAEQVIQERAAAEAEAAARAEEERAAIEDAQGEEAVNGDGIAPDPQPEPQPEPIPEVVEEKKEVVPVPQAEPEAIVVETTQTVVVEGNVIEPEVIQEEAPKPEAPTKVEPAVIETAPGPAPEPETESVAVTEVVEEVVFEEKVVEPEVVERASDPEAEPVPGPVETEPVETEPVETKPVETKPVETEPVETKPVETEPVETEPVETEPVETEPVETEPVETKPVGTKPVETEPVEAKLVETKVVEKVEEEETGELVLEPDAKFEDEVVEKAALKEVMTKTEIASDGTPKTEPIIEKKEETPVVGQSISEFKPEAEMERVKPEELVVAAVEETIREVVKDEDSKMVDVSPLSLPVEKTIIPEPTPVQDDTTAESTSKPEPEPELQQPSIDLMDTTEGQTDIRKRKRRSITPTPSSVRVGEPENQQSNECAISKKLRRDSTENQPQRTRPKDARFKGLFKDSSSTVTANNPPTASHHYNQAADQAMNQSTTQIEDEDDTPIPPSIHPATRALYIRNFARPLSEPALKAHLTALASPPSSTSAVTTSQPSESPIEYLYLDTIKSHALIIFTTLTAATRVRVGIHTKVWPNERSRKPLWADFVPEESVAGWVDRERQRGPGARWEVIYDREAGEGGVRAELEEVGGRRRVGPGGNTGVEVLGAPTGPRGERRGVHIAERDFGARSTTSNFAAATTDPAITNSATQRTAATGGGGRIVVKDLDQLFRSTVTKPKLYWMPVDPEISRERLAAYERGRGNTGNAGAGSGFRRRR
ncbi:hypothetical protein HOY80DRAFT_1136899 [Tuber brumale]|nr:hypothetical protein HOY80DRAFT_1136899 [Tuber brumale]